jgi:NAD(P)-dependent dehydrogenase (short-subunit alcohol dehydrogenase family)
VRLDSLFALDGRTALITGGGTGIGLAMAEALGRQGANVILVGRRANILEGAVAKLKAMGITIRFVSADLGAADGPDLVADQIGEPPDIVINAAGMNLRQAFEDVSLDAFDQHMAIHLRAPFRLTQRFAPAMAQRGFGRIIMLASLQSVRAFPDSAPYGAAKGGVVQLVRAIAERWSAQGITCNAIAPGFFPTPLTEPVFQDAALATKRAGQTAIGRNGALNDLFGTVIFLAAEASGYVTGQTLFIDGGFTAK